MYWIKMLGLLSLFWMAGLVMIAVVLGSVKSELEKLRCRADLLLGLQKEMYKQWNPVMLRMHGMNSFIQEFIGRLESEASLHSQVRTQEPQVTLEELEQRADQLVGKDFLTEVDELYKMHDLPDERPNPKERLRARRTDLWP